MGDNKTLIAYRFTNDGKHTASLTIYAQSKSSAETAGKITITEGHDVQPYIYTPGSITINGGIISITGSEKAASIESKNDVIINGGQITINGTVTDSGIVCGSGKSITLGYIDDQDFIQVPKYLSNTGAGSNFSSKKPTIADGKKFAVMSGNDFTTLDKVIDSTGNFDVSDLNNKKLVPSPIVTVTFNANNGTGTMEPQTFNSGTATKLKKNTFTYDGTFKGWNTKADGTGTSYSDEAEVTLYADVTLYAQWNLTQHKITYNLNGGTNNANNPATYTIETNTITLQDATRTGYTFGGWYSDSNFTTQVTSIQQGSTDDKTFYAKWTVITYNMTYDLKGGSVSTANPGTYNIETDTFTLTNPTKTYYIFNGWTGTDLNQATQSVTIQQGSINDRSYTATWAINKELWGGDDADGSAEKPYVITTLDGWGLLAHEINVEGNANLYSQDIFVLNADLTVSTMIKGFTGTFDGAGHVLTVNINSDSSNEDYCAPFSEVTGAVIKDLVVKGSITTGGNYSGGIVGVSSGDTRIEKCVFAGKLLTTNTNAVGGGFVGENKGTLTIKKSLYIPAALEDGEKELNANGSATFTRDNTNASSTITDSYYLYTLGTAQGVQAYYVSSIEGISVTLDDTSAKGLCFESIIYAGADETITISITGTGDEQSGYTFTGYKTDGGTLIESGNKFLLTLPADDVIISFNYDANIYTVSFNPNKGTGTQIPDMYITYDAGEYTLTANTYTRTGYDFTGWNTLSDGSGISFADKAAIKNLTSNITLYAQWQAITYSITYNLDGGTLAQDNPTSYTIETESFTLTNPTKDGYTFTGWTGTDLTEATQTLTINQGSTGDREYTANYTQNQQEQQEQESEQEQEQYEDTITDTPESLNNMTPAQKAAVINLTLTDSGTTTITDLSQVNFDGFTNLTNLDLSKLTNLEEADLSKIPESVKNVNLQNSNISSLNLNNSKVERVNAAGCKNLTNIDAEDNTSLTELNVSESNITMINVKNCSRLQSLNCSSCDIEAGYLNLEGCINLVLLDISRNHFGWFDYDEANLSALNYFDCYSQDIKDWESKKTFSFTKFFNSGDVTAASVEIMASAYINNVYDITGYTASGDEIITEYDPQTGVATFESAPAVIKYFYDTGFDNSSMDVTIRASSYNDEDESNYLDGSGCGGCNSGLTFSSLIFAMFAFMFNKRR